MSGIIRLFSKNKDNKILYSLTFFVTRNTTKTYMVLEFDGIKKFVSLPKNMFYLLLDQHLSPIFSLNYDPNINAYKGKELFIKYVDDHGELYKWNNTNTFNQTKQTYFPSHNQQSTYYNITAKLEQIGYLLAKNL